MNWHYEMNGAPVGPISDEQMELAKSRGGIQAGTRVWCEGWPDWKTAGEAWPEFFAKSVSAALPGTPDSGRCAECGAPHASLMPLGGVQVCPNCMPRAVAKLREGVSLGTPAGYEGPWREGKYLVTTRNGPMPDVCIKCGGVPVTHLRKTLTWHHPAIYLTLLLCNIGVLVYIIVALLVRKKAKVQVPVCAACSARRKRNLAIGWLSFALSIVMFFVSITVVESDDAKMGFALAGGALILFSLIWAVGIQFVLAKKITDQFVWISKAGKKVLETLPEFPGA
jgi:hypothetical protein